MFSSKCCGPKRKRVSPADAPQGSTAGSRNQPNQSKRSNNVTPVINSPPASPSNHSEAATGDRGKARGKARASGVSSLSSSPPPSSSSSSTTLASSAIKSSSSTALSSSSSSSSSVVQGVEQVLPPSATWSTRDHEVDTATGLAFRAAPDNTGNLFASIKRGETAKCEQLVRNGADVNEKGMWGNSPLIAACQNNKPEIAMLLLNSKQGRDRSDSDENGSTLQLAPINIDAMNERGYTALLFAAMYGMEEVIDALLQQGASGDVPESKAYNPVLDKSVPLTPLSVSIMNGHMSIVERLLGVDCGCDPNERLKGLDSDAYGGYPLHLAINRQLPEAMIKLLLRQGADVYALDSRKRSALDIALKHKESNPAIAQLIEQWSSMQQKFDSSRGGGQQDNQPSSDSEGEFGSSATEFISPKKTENAEADADADADDDFDYGDYDNGAEVRRPSLTMVDLSP